MLSRVRLPNSGVEPESPASAGRFFTNWATTDALPPTRPACKGTTSLAVSSNLRVRDLGLYGDHVNAYKMPAPAFFLLHFYSSYT